MAATGAKPLIVRVAHSGGRFRVEVPPTASLKDLYDACDLKNPARGRRAVLSKGIKPGGEDLDLEKQTPLQVLNFKRGEQVYMEFRGEMSAAGEAALRKAAEQALDKKMARIPIKGSISVGRKYVYKEDQYSAMCGMHAMNSLLQCHGESEKDCEAAARELEERYTSETGIRDHENQFRDEHGNYNIEVLLHAFSKRNIQLTLLTHPSMELFRKNPVAAEGFLLNRANHWFSIRRVHGNYWILDSTQELPEFCGDLHLDAKIQAMLQAGYTVHVCQGMLATPKPSLHSKNQLYDIERLMYEIKKNNQSSRVQATQSSSGGMSLRDSAKLQQLLNLGMFSREQCENALRQANGNPEAAANMLLQSM